MGTFLKKFTTTALVGIVGSAVFYTPAHAVSSAYVRAQHNKTRSHVSKENEKVREQVKTSIELQTELLIEALKGQARENSNYQQMQVEGAQRIEDAAQINHTNRLKDEFRAKAESGAFDPNPFACMLADIFGGQGSGAGGGATGNGSDVAARVGDWYKGKNPAVQEGGVTLTKHISDKKDEFAGYGGKADATTDWSLLLENPSIDLTDPKMAEVAEIIVRNGLDSTPDRDINPAEKLTPEGLDRIAKRSETDTRLGASNESIKMALNMASQVMEGKARDEMAKLAEQSAYNRPIPSKISELQQLDIMTVWHYAPTGDRQETFSAGMSEQAWLQEIHHVMSVNTRIQYLQLELMARDAVVNAYTLSTMNDDD